MQLKYPFWRGPDTTYDRSPLTPEQIEAYRPKKAGARAGAPTTFVEAACDAVNFAHSAGIPIEAAKIYAGAIRELAARVEQLEKNVAPAHLSGLEKRG